MADEVKTPRYENRENDLLDMSVATATSVVFFMSMALVALIITIVF